MRECLPSRRHPALASPRTRGAGIRGPWSRYRWLDSRHAGRCARRPSEIPMPRVQRTRPGRNRCLESRRSRMIGPGERTVHVARLWVRSDPLIVTARWRRAGRGWIRRTRPTTGSAKRSVDRSSAGPYHSPPCPGQRARLHRFGSRPRQCVSGLVWAFRLV